MRGPLLLGAGLLILGLWHLADFLITDWSRRRTLWFRGHSYELNPAKLNSVQLSQTMSSFGLWKILSFRLRDSGELAGAKRWIAQSIQ